MLDAGIAARATPTMPAVATQYGETAPVDASSVRRIAAGARPIPIAAMSQRVGDLSKRFRVEAIADASNRQDQFRVRVGAFDMLAQAAHMHVDRPRFDEGVAAPDHVEQLLAGVHA